MKKSLLVVAALVASVVVLSSCGKKSSDSPAEKKYTCTCTATSVAKKENMTATEKAQYEADCKAAVVATSLTKTAGAPSCEEQK